MTMNLIQMLALMASAISTSIGLAAGATGTPAIEFSCSGKHSVEVFSTIFLTTKRPSDSAYETVWTGADALLTIEPQMGSYPMKILNVADRADHWDIVLTVLGGEPIRAVEYQRLQLSKDPSKDSYFENILDSEGHTGLVSRMSCSL